MYVQNFSPKFYHLRHFKKEKRCSLNFCTDYSKQSYKMYTSPCRYLHILPVLHRADVVGVFSFVGVNTIYRKTCHMPKGL